MLTLGIIGIITISFISCSTKSISDNGKANDVSTDAISNTSSDAEKDGAININSNEDIDKTITYDNAADIDIDISVAEVSIKSYDGNDMKITGKLSEKSKGMTINTNDNKIQIVEKSDKTIKYDGNEYNKSKIDILVPSKFNGDFTFKQGIGKSVIEGIKVKNIDITGGTGELNCDDIKFNNLKLDSGVGKVDLNLKEKCGDMNIKGNVGETNITMAEVGGNLKYKGGVGSSNITIPKDSPVRFLTKKGVGSCKVDAKPSGKDTYTFDLEVGVGSIDVRN